MDRHRKFTSVHRLTPQKTVSIVSKGGTYKHTHSPKQEVNVAAWLRSLHMSGTEDGALIAEPKSLPLPVVPNARSKSPAKQDPKAQAATPSKVRP